MEHKQNNSSHLSEQKHKVWTFISGFSLVQKFVRFVAFLKQMLCICLDGRNFAFSKFLFVNS